MSTRSQLRFVHRVEQPGETDDSADRVAQVYRHSDGYPGSALRELAQLKELLDATRAERGPGYTAAAFVVVELPTESPFDEPAEWTVKVSEHTGFPRWDGATDEAFKRASWQFHGSLEDALEDFLTEPA